MLIVLCSPIAADVVLHPGTVTGTVGVTGLTATPNSGSISISGNTNGFSASANYTGNQFSVTVEGNQTYSFIRLDESFTDQPGSFTIQRQQPFVVAVGGTTNLDFVRPAGIIRGQVGVIGDPAGTTGTIVQFVYGASADNPNLGEHYQGNGSGSASSDAAFVMVANSSMTIFGGVSINLVDASGATCRTSQSFPQDSVSLAPGATLVVHHDVDVRGLSCSSTVTGTVAVNNTPEGIVPGAFLIEALGSVDSNVQQVTGNNTTYRIGGLIGGDYRMLAIASFDSFRESLSLPNHNPPTVRLNAGQVVQRDFVFDGALVATTIRTKGLVKPFSAGLEFSGAKDSGQPNGGPSAGGKASFFNEFSSGATAVLSKGVFTPGIWNLTSEAFTFIDPLGQTSVQISETLPRSVNVTGGATVTLPDVVTTFGQASVVFDVAEPAGSPPVIISGASIEAGHVDPGKSISIRTFSAANAPSPSVRLIGPPSVYQFTASASVSGSSVIFPPSSIEIGQPINTASGGLVQVIVADGDGNPLPVTLIFQSVLQDGDTSGSTTAFGPVPPADADRLVAFKGQPYLGLETSASFSGKILMALQYDPAALGLTATQERALTLQQFVCVNSSCGWKVINETYTAGDPRSFGRIAPAGGNPDVINHVIYGVTDSIGTFGLFLSHAVPMPPADTCIGTATLPALLSTDPAVCFAAINNANKRAGGCADGGSGLLSCTFDGLTSEQLPPGDHSVAIVGTAGDGSAAACSSRVRVTDQEPPTLDCPVPRTLECSGPSTAVTLNALCSDNCGACNVACDSGPFRIGATLVSCMAADPSGNKTSCTTNVTVVDTRAPDLTVTATPHILRPPNHKLRPVSIDAIALDQCDPHPTVTCDAFSNDRDRHHREEDKAKHDGDAGRDRDDSDDLDIVRKNGALFLRAEPGVVYTISCKAVDASGNGTVKTTTVSVPRENDEHDER
jgi:hypothetical protein